ncbi:MAG: LysM peptidoglycan-binding domain-containing protein [Micrococcales bacterium]|nr:LysM peptidoglycan-binding domain-containing protein [Micrococcales bacterium]
MLRSTVPIVLAGAVTVSLSLTGPIESAAAARTPAPERSPHGRPATTPGLSPAAAAVPRTIVAAPASYSVVRGDTVSGIAERFGLSIPAVLALNGLSWRSLIHPGQVLRLTAPSVAAPTAPAAPAVTAPMPSAGYTIQRGDTISGVAARFGVPTAQLLAANGLAWSSIIYPGQRIAVPGTVGMVAASSVTPAPAPAAPAPPATTTAYTIVRGDTVSAIATRHGISIDAILAANGLTRASLIYAGRVLQIPAAGTATAARTDAGTPAPASGSLTPDAVANVRTIVRVGRSLGVPESGIVVALAAAAQESGLQNLPHGDRDSVGLFQQRPSTGWGTAQQLLDPAYAARLFYGGPSNPNAGRTRGLLDIPGWQAMSVTQAAQAVQISAFPDRYARWEAPARGWLALA